MKNNNNRNTKSSFVSLITSKKAKRGSLSIAITAIFIAVIVGLNIITTLLANRGVNMSVDLTADKVYKLTDDSIEQVNKLSEDVTIYVLAKEKELEDAHEYYYQINKLLHEFENHSKHITLKYVDLPSEPTFINKYPNVEWYSQTNLLLVECGENYLSVTPEDVFVYDEETYMNSGEFLVTGQKLEQATLTAILNVITVEKVGVTFIDDNLDNHLNKTLVGTLTNNAYTVNFVSLASNEIPEDSKFLVLFAPNADMSEFICNKISDWLYNDGEYGRTFLYVPHVEQNPNTPNIDKLLEEWGMAVGDSIIHETDPSYIASALDGSIVSLYHVDNLKFDSNLNYRKIPVVMRTCAPIEILDPSASSLLSTSESAYIESNLPNSKVDPDTVIKEKYSGGAISTKGESEDKQSNVIVIGSPYLFSADAMSTNTYKNKLFTINLFHTIADRNTASIIIEGTPLNTNELNIQSQKTASNIIFVSRYLIPFIFIAAGVAVIILRRVKHG